MTSMFEIDSPEFAVFATPDWRWMYAHSYLVDPDRRPIGDAMVQTAVSFLTARMRQSTFTPGTSTFGLALEIYEENGQTRWKLESLVLARQSIETIAARLKLDPAVVAIYESVFFHARHRLKQRQWILRLFTWGPKTDLATLWRWVAYFRGVQGLDLVIAVTIGEGRERYSEVELDDTEIFVELHRMPIGQQPERIAQLLSRFDADPAGGHPSIYHIPRVRRKEALDGSDGGTVTDTCPPIPIPLGNDEKSSTRGFPF